MLSVQENEKMTQIGPGTPMGEVFRRYWHPVAASVDLKENPTQAVRLLGESLVLYKDRSGQLGLLQESCPHRRVNLLYGIPEERGLRCPYHGWLFDETGRCLEMPAESPDSTFKDRVQAVSYPVEELGGLVWAYLGPQPTPLLPRWDLLVWDNVLRDIGTTVLPCNWMQCMENSLDPIHNEWLHGWYTKYMRDRRADVGGSALGVDSEIYEEDLKNGRIVRQMNRIVAGNFAAATEDTPHETKIGFDLFEHGIIKRRVWAGGSEEDASWRIGHSVVFPNTLRVGTGFQIRVPLDDTHTRHYHYVVYTPAPGVQAPKQEDIPHYEFPLTDKSGRHITDFTIGQDLMAWATQGPVAERHLEKLAESDKGIILYRRLLKEQMGVVHDGGEPINVFRDPAKNQTLDLFQENMPERTAAMFKTRSIRDFGVQRYGPLVDAIDEMYAESNVILDKLQAE